MKILSIDVGIKNLAFCILESYENKYVIKEWDVINLCKKQLMLCKQKKKNGEECFTNHSITYCTS